MKKKLRNFWYYYKWYLVVAAVAAVLLVDFALEKGKIVQPDYQAAIVTGSWISEERRTQLEETLEKLWDDRNGDGQIHVQVNFYRYDAQTTQTDDTAAFMASAVQLAADLRLGESVCFLTDCPQLLMENGSGLSTVAQVEQTCLKDWEELQGFTLLSGEEYVDTAQYLVAGK